MKLEEAKELANYILSSGLYPNVTEAEAVVKIIAGHEQGIPPISALKELYIKDGKVCYSSALIAAKIKQSRRYDYEVQEHDEFFCKINFYEETKGVGSAEFSIQDAENMGLTDSPMWQKQPAVMLYCRALTKGARMYCPDLFNGSIYTPDEIGAKEVVVDTKGKIERAAPPKESPKNFAAASYIIQGDNKLKGRMVRDIPLKTLERMAQETNREKVTLEDKAAIQMYIAMTKLEGK